MASLAGCSDAVAQIGYDDPDKIFESFFESEFESRGLTPLSLVYGGGRGRAVSLFAENHTKRETAEAAGAVARAYRDADGDELEYARNRTPDLEFIQVAGVTESFDTLQQNPDEANDWSLHVAFKWTDELLAGELSESEYYDRIEATSGWPTEK